MASSEASSPRATLAARVPNCLTASLAASVATVAVRRAREVGIFSLSRAMHLHATKLAGGTADVREFACARLAPLLDARAGHDVVRAVLQRTHAFVPPS